MGSPEGFVTVSAAARRISVSLPEMWRLIEAGSIPVRALPAEGKRRRVLIPAEVVELLVAVRDPTRKALPLRQVLRCDPEELEQAAAARRRLDEWRSREDHQVPA